MSDTLEGQLQQILGIKNDIASSINAQGVSITEEDTFATYANKISRIQGGGTGVSAFNTFDIKETDRILRDDELIGWAEQGTKVYKSDYPDFYNACIQNFEQGTKEFKLTTIANVDTNVPENIEKGILHCSSFTTGQSVRTPMEFAPQAGQSWVFQLTFTTGSNITAGQNIINRYTLDNTVAGFCMTITNKSTLRLYLQSQTTVSGSNAFDLLHEYDTGYTVKANTCYKITFGFDGVEMYTFAVFQNDSIVYTYHLTSTAIMSAYIPEFGTYSIASSVSPFLGTIDLKQTFIKVDGEYLWNGTHLLECKKCDNEQLYCCVEDEQLINNLVQPNIALYAINTLEESVKLPVIEDTNKHIYYCVGNTFVNNSTIDITKEVQLNNPFFLGMGQYFENEPNNLSWLKSKNQFESKELYPAMYQWILDNANAGVTNFHTAEQSYDDYCFVVDQQNQTFRLPLLNGSEMLPGNNYQIIYYDDSTTAKDLLNQTFTLSQNGYVTITNTNSNPNVTVRNLTTEIGNTGQGQLENQPRASVFGRKGDVIQYVKSAINGDGSTTVVWLCPAVGNGDLYYYVGESVANAHLIDAQKAIKLINNKVDLDSNRFDGPWVHKVTTIIASDTTLPADKTTKYDLSTALPKDDYDYEAIFSIIGTTASSSGSAADVIIHTDFITSGATRMAYTVSRSSSAFGFGGTNNMIVGKDRFVTLQCSHAYIVKRFRLIAYRRLGKV